MTQSQEKIIEFLLENKSSYPHKVSKIKIKQTHISWILLTGRYVYKIKKQLRFGKILNFSTLRLRKKYCQIEVKINKLLCPNLYLGVVKIVEKNGSVRIANLQSKQKAIEYAVKMREIPQKYRMDILANKNKITKKTIERLVYLLIKFHKQTPTSNRIKKFGHPKIILKKIDENFRTLETMKTINTKYEKKLTSFINQNQELFSKRITEGKIRDIHGDLYLKNIFVLNNSKFYLYDRIEFNENLRFADIAEDVAHLSMDLDFVDKHDLRKYFISRYVKNSKDVDLLKFVYFWMCYKACVRAKVCLFQAKNEQNKTKKTILNKDAKRFFKLANSYISKI
jgi:aminoglycoside phosphotransferase family enzyme